MKPTKVIKKSHFMAMAMCFLPLSVSAQLKIASNGFAAFANTSHPLSPISVGYGGNSNYLVAISGNKNGILSQTMSTQIGFRYAGLFTAPVNGIAGFNIGILGEALSYSTPYNSGRSYGVYGQAANATNGFNYGVFGSLKGSHNGAAVYGTTNGDDGTDTGGIYAGYFHGDAMVTGNLYSTGSIIGSLLSTGFDGNITNMRTKTLYGMHSNESAELVSKLSRLELVAYSKEPLRDLGNIQDINADTIAAPRVVGSIEKLSNERHHYALSVEQLEASFPELVYEDEDGSKFVNYVELVPVLVQCINELSVRVAELEGSCVKSVSSFQTEQDVDVQQSQIYYPITVDGKLIGNKRVTKTK